MAGQTDKILCHGFVYECELGFHAHEHRIHQKIRVDLEVAVKPIPAAHSDQVSQIRLDYHSANRLMRDLLLSRKFNLLETVAEEISKKLLEEFNIESVKIRVTKYPLDMPNVEGVSYECVRERHGGS